MSETFLIAAPIGQVTFLTNEGVFSIFYKKLDLSNSFFKRSRTLLTDESVKMKYDILAKDGSILFSITLLRTERKSESFAAPEEIAKHKMQGLHHFHLTFRKGVTAEFVIKCLKEEGKEKSTHLTKEIMLLLSETPLAFDIDENNHEKDLKTFLDKTFNENTR